MPLAGDTFDIFRLCLLSLQIVGSSLSGGFLICLAVDLILDGSSVTTASYGLRTIFDSNDSHSGVSL